MKKAYWSQREAWATVWKPPRLPASFHSVMPPCPCQLSQEVKEAQTRGLVGLQIIHFSFKFSVQNFKSEKSFGSFRVILKIVKRDEQVLLDFGGFKTVRTQSNLNVAFCYFSEFFVLVDRDEAWEGIEVTFYTWES